MVLNILTATPCCTLAEYWMYIIFVHVLALYASWQAARTLILWSVDGNNWADLLLQFHQSNFEVLQSLTIYQDCKRHDRFCFLPY